MMLYITDNFTEFEKNKNDFKLLLVGWQISKCGFFTQEEIDNLNQSLNSIELLAADQMLRELYTLQDLLKDTQFRCNKYLNTRENKDRTHTLLYVCFWNFVIKKLVLKIITEKIIRFSHTSFSSISFALSDEYSLITLDFHKYFSQELNFSFKKNKKIALNNFKKGFKNCGYIVCHLAKKITGYPVIPPNGKKKVLLFLYDMYSQHSVLTTFFEKLKNHPDLHLIIIHLTSGIEKKYSADPFHLQTLNNITVLDYRLFRKQNFISHVDFYNKLIDIHPAYTIFKTYDALSTIENHYSWIGNVFENVKPDVCLNVALLDASRAMSDVARYYKVPSVNVEYGLFTDDSLYMESNCEFTARACIGEESVKIWKRRNDPTHNHPVIGFCKLDNTIIQEPDKESFFRKNGFNHTAQTIFFGSTWSSENKTYNEEKMQIVKELSVLCHIKKWNLLIKKHPSEHDSIVNEIIQKNNYPFQKVFEHKELFLNDAIRVADVVTCQSSSIVLEAMLNNKVFCFLTKNIDLNITSYNPLTKEPFVKTFDNIHNFENFIIEMQDKINRDKFIEALASVKERYLYKTDGQASQRLINLITSLAES